MKTVLEAGWLNWSTSSLSRWKIGRGQAWKKASQTNFIITRLKSITPFLRQSYKMDSVELGHLFFSGLVENVGEVASAAVLAIKMSRHENAGSAILVGTLTSQASDLAILIHLVILEHRKLDLLSLVLDLLGGGVVLLLALLATTSQAEDEMESRLLLDVVIGQSTTIFKLLAGENQTLLVGGNALLILNLGFHIFDGVTRLDL